MAKHTLETNPVAPETLHSLLEEILTLGRHTRDVVLFPLNGCIDIFEDLLDRVCDLIPNTITGDEGDLEDNGSGRASLAKFV